MFKKSNKFKSWWIIGLLIPFLGILIYYFSKSMEKETKSNLLTGTIIGFGIWIFVALSFMITVNGPEKEEEKVYMVSDWLTDTTSSEPVVTVLGLTTCGYCQNYKPVIEDLAEEYGFKLYFFETDTLSTEDENTLMNTYKFNEFEDMVPFTFIVKNGEVIAETTGFESEATTITFLQTNEVIK